VAQASGLMEALYRDRQSQRAAQPATGTARLEELQDGECPASKDGRTPGSRQGHSPGAGQGKIVTPIAAHPDPSEIRTPVRATTNRPKLKTSNPVDPLGIFQDHHSLATNIGNHSQAGATCQPSRQGRSRLSGSLQAIGAVPRRLEADGGDNRTRSPAAPPRFDRLNRIVTRYGLIPDRIKTTRCDQAKDGGSAPS